VLTLDGDMGEGGGQILRTALALSLVLCRPFRIERLRAGRRRPGLRRQHLACVLAAAEIGSAQIEGAALNSQTLSFSPTALRAGDYRFDIGSAGSTTLVVQTVLPALLAADGRSTLVVTGGTHNPLAPPFRFLEKAFLPLLRRMGAHVEANLVRPGYAPRGGGKIALDVAPAPSLKPFRLEHRGSPCQRQATATVAGLPRHIAERELAVVRERLGWPDDVLRVREESTELGPGNVLSIELAHEHVTEVFTGFGERGVRAETVAERTVADARRYLAVDVAAGPHLADQLLLPLALAGGGSFTTLAPTRHALTNWGVIRRFLDLELATDQTGPNTWRIQLGVS